MDVHVGQSGHQELASSIDPFCIFRNPNFPNRPDLNDETSVDNHGLVSEQPLAIHWNNTDVHERERRLVNGGICGLDRLTTGKIAAH
ncbi:MAG: hypothetical protein AB7J13_12650 [Pyrinomonadaceae bacterium]